MHSARHMRFKRWAAPQLPYGMVLTACKRGDEIILPRNVHRSVLNALVLCGAVPVYVNPRWIIASVFRSV